MNRLNFSNQELFYETSIYRFMSLIDELDTFIAGLLIKKNEPVMDARWLYDAFSRANMGAVNNMLVWSKTPLKHPLYFKGGAPDTEKSWKMISDIWDDYLMRLRKTPAESAVQAVISADSLLQRAADVILRQAEAPIMLR